MSGLIAKAQGVFIRASITCWLSVQRSKVTALRKASAPAATSAWLGREAEGAPVSQPTTLLHSGGGVKTQTQRLGNPGARFHVQNAQPITPSVLSIIATVVAVVSASSSPNSPTQTGAFKSAESADAPRNCSAR